MAGREHRLGVLGLVAILAGCYQETGPAGTWVPWDAVDGPLRPELGSPPAPRAFVDGAALRVVTYNVEYGEDVVGLAAAIAGDPALAGAGLLLVQEIESYPGEGSSRAARLAAALELGWVYAPARPEGDGTHGLAVFSPYPLENLQVMELPFVDLPISDHRRIAVALDVRLGARTLHVVNLHLDTRLNVTDRIVQLRPAVIDAPDQVLVGGDFNMNAYVWAEGAVPLVPVDSLADSDQAPIIDDYMGALGFATPTAALGATQQLGPVDSRLDAIYARGLVVVPGAVERDVDESDHWPLWVDLVLP